MPVTRSQSSATQEAAVTLVGMRYSMRLNNPRMGGNKVYTKVQDRPQRLAAVKARELLKLYADADDE